MIVNDNNKAWLSAREHKHLGYKRTYGSIYLCMQDSFARARTRPSARATIGYLVYKIYLCTLNGKTYILTLYCMQYDFARALIRLMQPLGLP